MIKITRQGKKVEPKFEGRCDRCHTEIECDKSDLILDPPDRPYEPPYYHVDCPTCGSRIHTKQKR